MDSKLNILVKEISLNKDLRILINNDKEIVLNQKIIGKIIGVQAKLYELDSYKKNKIIYNKVIDKVSEAICRTNSSNRIPVFLNLLCFNFPIFITLIINNYTINI